MTRGHVMAPVGGQDENAVGSGDKRGVTVLLLTGKPGQGAIVPSQAATADSAPAAGKGKALGFAASPFFLFFLRSCWVQVIALLGRKACNKKIWQ